MPNTDDLKGRAKQAAGDVTGNDRLKREGSVDRAAGKAKEVVRDGVEKVEKAVDTAKEKVEETLHRH